jgi:hypothetical protein
MTPLAMEPKFNLTTLNGLILNGQNTTLYDIDFLSNSCRSYIQKLISYNSNNFAVTGIINDYCSQYI